jgi:hypothetical protein
MELPNPTQSKGQLWTGRILSALAVLFLLFDATLKFVKPPAVVEGTIALGYSPSQITPIGITLLICVILYCIPNTQILGAILLTGYLGGAVATHVRHGDPLFSHILAPTYLGVFLWQASTSATQPCEISSPSANSAKIVWSAAPPRRF